MLRVDVFGDHSSNEEQPNADFNGRYAWIKATDGFGNTVHIFVEENQADQIIGKLMEWKQELARLKEIAEAM